MARSQNPKRRRRHGISDYERQKIRSHQREHPHLMQKHLAIWATNTFRYKFNQSIISEILSNKFSYLDLIEIRHK